jgi:hypothetical protein
MMTGAEIAVISVFGSIGYAAIGFVTSAVVAATTRTAVNHETSVPSGYFSVFAGVVWPAAIVVAMLYFLGCLFYGLGCVLKPGRWWLRLVRRLNPGVKVYW